MQPKLLRWHNRVAPYPDAINLRTLRTTVDCLSLATDQPRLIVASRLTCPVKHEHSTKLCLELSCHLCYLLCFRRPSTCTGAKWAEMRSRHAPRAENLYQVHDLTLAVNITRLAREGRCVKHRCMCYGPADAKKTVNHQYSVQISGSCTVRGLIGSCVV
jgi:hypothetical protein